jgi:hypothetical protein
MDQQPLSPQHCAAELKAVEKEIKELNEKILEVSSKDPLTEGDKRKLDKLESQLSDLKKDKEYWQTELRNAQQSTLSKTTERRESDSSASSTGKPPHPDRKRRWDKLNEILAANKKKNKTTATTGYSYVTWNDVKSVFPIVDYVQPVKAIPDDAFNVLESYIKFASKCLGDIITGKEAQRLHFIAPIIICVCYLFDGDLIIEIEEDLNGQLVKAHGHFEFVLRRGDKRVCIVEAKKDDMEQGLAQDLLGCEVASELGNLDVVYGIVTNYLQWIFVRSLHNKIERQLCSFQMSDSGVPTKGSLAEIVGKIYALLSTDDQPAVINSDPSGSNNTSESVKFATT